MPSTCPWRHVPTCTGDWDGRAHGGGTAWWYGVPAGGYGSYDMAYYGGHGQDGWGAGGGGTGAGYGAGNQGWHPWGWWGRGH